MERRAELFEAPEMGEIVELKLVELLPETCYVGALYTLEGTVKLFGVGAPPWVYVKGWHFRQPYFVLGEGHFPKGRGNGGRG
ncbi:hypothetical protein ES703_96462 [subsurface metagenome]